MDQRKKLLVIVGPTASGKSDLAVEAALRFDGEVVSADSRQIYKKLDIATGKITQDEMKGIPHYLLDVADPQEQFNVALFKEKADEVIDDIHERNKLPILAGGTGFYIQAIVDDVVLPDVPPNDDLRHTLENVSVDELRERLKKLDPKREAQITQDNPRRLIRAIEIAQELGEVPTLQKNERFDTLEIGLAPSKEDLKARIRTRTEKRLDEGMIEEAQKLYDEGISLERMRELGLEYEHLADYLEEDIDRKALIERINRSDLQYAKRQMTWFKCDSRIKWFDPENKEKILNEIRSWLTV